MMDIKIQIKNQTRVETENCYMLEMNIFIQIYLSFSTGKFCICIKEQKIFLLFLLWVN